MTSLPELHWFVAVLVFESSLIEAWLDPDVDIQFRLVRATDAEAAYREALDLGREGEHSYENSYGQTCVWSFQGLKDLQEVLEDKLADGVEVYGFIEDGTALDHVMSKEQLTVFRSHGPMDVDSETAEWCDDA